MTIYQVEGPMKIRYGDASALAEGNHVALIPFSPQIKQAIAVGLQQSILTMTELKPGVYEVFNKDFPNYDTAALIRGDAQPEAVNVRMEVGESSTIADISEGGQEPIQEDIAPQTAIIIGTRRTSASMTFINFDVDVIIYNDSPADNPDNDQDMFVGPQDPSSHIVSGSR